MLEICSLIARAGRTHFWYDELLTLHVSALQPFTVLLSALHAGADGMPPAYYVIVRLARLLPLDSQITLRLPSILGYIITLLGVYWFTRKRLTVAAGLTAVLLITQSPFRSCALEARSYALIVGFLAVAAVLWQKVDESRVWMAAFCAFLTAAVACHHLAVVALSIFAFAEVVRTVLSRGVRWGVWGSFLLAATPFLASLPMLMHFRAIFGRSFWSLPDWGTIFSTYRLYVNADVNLGLILAIVILVACAVALPKMVQRWRNATPEAHFPIPEVVLICGFLCYPALLVLLTMLMGSGYVPRYGWPAIFGLASGAVYLLRNRWRDARLLILPATFFIVFAMRSTADLRPPAAADPNVASQWWAHLMEAGRNESTLPIVITGGAFYLEAVQYAPPSLRDRFVCVVAPDAAVRLTGSDTVDRGNRILSRFVPLRVEELARFQSAHRRFLVVSDGGRFDWLTPYLIERKYPLSFLSRNGDATLYLAGQ